MKFMVVLKSFFWLGLGVFLAVSCWSYNISDSSWNTAGIQNKNIFGSVGSITADLMWQFLGWMTVLVIFSCFLWSFHSIKNKVIRYKKTVLVLAILLGSWLSVSFPVDGTRYFPVGKGGYIGLFLGSWGVFSQGWIRFILWLIWCVLIIYVLALPVRWSGRVAFKMIRLSFKGMKFLLSEMLKVFPFMRRMKPVIQKAEQVVEPLKKIRIKKEKKEVKTSVKKVPEPTQVNRFQLPSEDLLAPAKTMGATISREAIATNSRALEVVLSQFGISGKIVGAQPGPVVTLYEFEPASGIKTARVIALSDDIAREMKALSVRISVIPGSNVIGIEMPNSKRDTVYIRELVESDKFKAHTGALPLILGKDIGGGVTYADLSKMPHLLVAGTTGSGKSVAINTMILSLLYRFTPAECRLILVDPKMVELSVYNNIPHLLTPVVTEAPKAVVALKWAVREMEDRYRSMSQLGVRNIDGYNQKLLQAARSGQVLKRRVQTGFDPQTGKPIIEEQVLDLTPIPYIVMIVDEMSDLMGQCGKEAEPPILRLAQMARAVGIHLILATQRPSVDVITGLIKANFPTRISFQVTNKIDSRTILDEQGAERLLGRGDMLYRPAGSNPIRLHGPFVSDEEVEKVVNFWRNQGEPEYVDAVITDIDSGGGLSAPSGQGDVGGESGDLYDKAVAIILRDKKVSTSYVQRQLRIGYNRAADLIDRMESEGIISKPNIAGKREILVPTDNA